MKQDCSECIINAEMLILMKICPITILMYAYTLYIYIPYKKPEMYMYVSFWAVCFHTICRLQKIAKTD